MTDPLIPATGFLSAIAPIIQQTGGQPDVDENGQFTYPDDPFEAIRSITLTNNQAGPTGFEQFLIDKHRGDR